MDERTLPADWRSSPPPPAVQAIGDQWVAAARSLAIRVPSAVVPYAANVLLNPEHASVDQVIIHPHEPFDPDDRLRKLLAM